MNDPLTIIQETDAMMRVAFHHVRSFPGVNVNNLEEDYKTASGEARAQFAHMQEIVKMTGMNAIGYQIPVMEFMEEIREKVENIIRYLCILKYGEAFLDAENS
jgi:hypothetical protein